MYLSYTKFIYPMCKDKNHYLCGAQWMNKRSILKIVAILVIAIIVAGLILSARLIIPPIIEYITILRGLEVVYEIADAYIDTIHLGDSNNDKYIDYAIIELHLDKQYNKTILIEIYLYDKDDNLLDYGNLTTIVPDLLKHSYYITLHNVAYVDYIKKVVVKVYPIGE